MLIEAPIPLIETHYKQNEKLLEAVVVLQVETERFIATNIQMLVLNTVSIKE